jgi:TfoX/Sxy family transcriptional regulator of competence genes
VTKASKELIAELEDCINTAATGLSKVTHKKMFGCHALFANEAVFGLVWKEGRIGVRLPDSASFDSLMSEKGAAPWKAGKMTMSHWVLVPEDMHEEKAQLKRWLKVARGMAGKAEKKPTAKKSPTKKKASTKSR